METSGPTSGIAPRPGPAASTASAPWRAGQLLHATVTEGGAGRVLLAIGHRQVSAETSLPLEKGQQLTLQVQTTGQQPVLRILSPAADTTLSTAVRFLLPRQGPMTPLLSSLNQLTTAPQAALPGLIQQLIRSLVRQMPTVESAATPRGLKQALQDSGVFLERHLLQLPAPGVNQAALGADLKANLLRLLQLLRDWPAGEHRGASAAAQKPGTGGTPDTAPSALSGPAAGGARAPLQRAVEFGQLARAPWEQALRQDLAGVALEVVDLERAEVAPVDGDQGLPARPVDADLVDAAALPDHGSPDLGEGALDEAAHAVRLAGRQHPVGHGLEHVGGPAVHDRGQDVPLEQSRRGRRHEWPGTRLEP